MTLMGKQNIHSRKNYDWSGERGPLEKTEEVKDKQIVRRRETTSGTAVMEREVGRCFFFFLPVWRRRIDGMGEVEHGKERRERVKERKGDTG